MFVKDNDSGVRYIRKGNVDAATYFFRALIVHEGHEKLISSWHHNQESAKILFNKSMSELGGDYVLAVQEKAHR